MLGLTFTSARAVISIGAGSIPDLASVAVALGGVIVGGVVHGAFVTATGAAC